MYKSGKILYYTIEFGSYPQDKARNSSELEKLYNAHKFFTRENSHALTQQI